MLSKIRYGKAEDCQMLTKITEDCQILSKIRYGKAEDSAIIQDWIWKADERQRTEKFIQNQTWKCSGLSNIILVKYYTRSDIERQRTVKYSPR